jgi:hypothetical protein
MEIHERLGRLAKEKAVFEAELGRSLLLGEREAVHRHLGFATYAEYLERLFGFSPREVKERLRVARALEELPCMQDALETGRLCWSAARELSRVATPGTEEAWLSAISDKTVREVEELVSGRVRGDGPDAPPDDEARRHVLRFEVGGATLALVNEALAKLRRDAEGPLEEEEALALMARMVLGGRREAGTSSYQIALTVCERCERGWQEGKGELVRVTPNVVAMAACDATHIGHIGRVPRRGGETHVGPTRASQTIPPRVRRLVSSRDHGACVVPGCRSCVFVDVHHLDPRAEGGSHDPDNLVTLCGAHHKRVHEGSLIITRSADGLLFTHADGSPYGSPTVEAAVADLHAQAFGALVGLGFKESAVRRALERLRQHGDGNTPREPHEAPLEGLIRAALAVLSSEPCSPRGPRRHVRTSRHEQGERMLRPATLVTRGSNAWSPKESTM